MRFCNHRAGNSGAKERVPVTAAGHAQQLLELLSAAIRSLAIGSMLQQEAPMLGWAITFLVIALVAALFGFGGIAGVAVEAAKIVFFVAIVLFVLSALFGLFRGRRTLP
jgi:uncharacterized membrane protein YtjA (UPF0391 family)